MPIFEYRCRNCHQLFEALIRSDEQARCPECGSAQNEKLLSVTAAHTQRSGRPAGGTNCPPPDAPPCGPGCCRLT